MTDIFHEGICALFSVRLLRNSLNIYRAKNTSARNCLDKSFANLIWEMGVTELHVWEVGLKCEAD
jgi:hypothetical protein